VLDDWKRLSKDVIIHIKKQAEQYFLT